MIWFVKIMLAGSLALFGAWAVNRLISKALVATQDTIIPWDKALLRSVRQPLMVFIWGVTGFWIADILQAELAIGLEENIKLYRKVGVIVITLWFMSRFVRHAEGEMITSQMKRGVEPDYQTYDIVGKSLRLLIYILGAIVIIQEFGLSLSGVLAFGGIGGMVLAFAARDTLSDLFSGANLYADRNFKKGDWVRTEAFEGTVEEIGWRQTKITSFESLPMWVPNRMLQSLIIENPSMMQHRRFKWTMDCEIGDMDQVLKSCAESKEYLRAHSRIDPRRGVIVDIDDVIGDTVQVLIKVYSMVIQAEEHAAMKSEVLAQIIKIFQRNGVVFKLSQVRLSES